MSRIGILITYIIGSAVLASLIAYPVHLALEVEFERIVSRSILIFLVLLFYPTCRLLNIDLVRSLGFPRSGRSETALKAWLIGVLSLVPISIFFLNCGYRLWEPFSSHDLLSPLITILSAIVAGLIIGVIEETLFRGLLQTELANAFNTTTSIFLVCFIYSCVHFLEAQEAINPEHIRWNSGLAMLVSSFSPLGQPFAIWDSWLALFTAGLFLSLIRLRTNNILWCIGIHAGWVAHIKVYKAFTDRDSGATCAVLAGNYDRYIGELSIIWISLLLLVWTVYHLRTRNR